jgi:two-component system CAI-1 autoinducer sensor kinase/phosphatase CqsS
MYSILPAVVSLLFLGYGAYVLGSRGASRAALTFFLVCVTTFCWQFTWAILFQVRNQDHALQLARIGYLLILFLPTTLYHFTVELTRRRADMAAVRLSYLAAAVLGLLLFGGNAVVAGVHHSFFGFYPSAGPLHPLHLLQTCAVILRAVAILVQEQRRAVSTERLRLRFCLASLLIYFLAAVDYLCNYGLEFYPPGVVFIAISLGIIAQAMARHNLLANPMLLAATVAHELRTPLATIRNQARVLAKGLPELVACYEKARREGGNPGTLRPDHLDYLRELGAHIEVEVSRSNFITDMVLASANPDVLCKRGFARHSAEKCIEEALASYPFDEAARSKIVLHKQGDFSFHGSDTLMIYVLYNLIKNALAAVDGVAHGRIEIALRAGGGGNNSVTISDTGHGIPEHVLPHVFDPFYTTKSTRGTGMGLAFCRRVVTAFGGTIHCRSREGAFTMMAMEFPAA